MGKFIDLTGKRFGGLTVINMSGRKNGRIMWLCKCDCGNTKAILGKSLKNGHTKSCGCLKDKFIKETHATRDGLSRTRLCNIWFGIKNRCYSRKNHGYRDYGGRGISVCKEWRDDFAKFREWSLNNGYNENLTIDRINVNGNYEPSNCRWATLKEQQNNRRCNRLITYNNITKTITEWSETLGINQGTLFARLYAGKRGKELFEQPFIKISYNGTTKTVKQWSEILGIKTSTILKRREKGWTNEEILHGRSLKG